MQVKNPELIKALMASLNISGRQLSEDVGWNSHTYLQRILRGEIRTVKQAKAELIAMRLGVPRDVLFVPRVSGNTGQYERQNRPSKAS